MRRLNTFRLWVLVSAIWTVGVVIYMAPEFRSMPESRYASAPKSSATATSRFDPAKADAALFPDGVGAGEIRATATFDPAKAEASIRAEMSSAGESRSALMDIEFTRQVEDNKASAAAKFFEDAAYNTNEILDTFFLIFLGVIGFQAIPRILLRIWHWLFTETAR